MFYNHHYHHQPRRQRTNFFTSKKKSNSQKKSQVNDKLHVIITLQLYEFNNFLLKTKKKQKKSSDIVTDKYRRVVYGDIETKTKYTVEPLIKVN